MIMASKCVSNLARSQPPSVSPKSRNHGLPDLTTTASNSITELAQSQPSSVSPNSHDSCLQGRMITASKCMSNLIQSQPPSVSPYSLNSSLQVCGIRDSKCRCNIARSQPRSASSNSLDYSCQVYLNAYSITAAKCISKFTLSRCGGTLQLDGPQRIINTMPHLAWNLTGIGEKELLYLEECKRTVIGYEWIRGHDEPYKLCGAMHAWQKCMRNNTSCLDL